MGVATAIRPVAIADTFESFAIVGGTLNRGQTRLLDSSDTLDGCLALTAGRVAHKGHFMVRHTSALTGAVMLSFYVVKKAKPVLRFYDHQQRMVADTYPEKLFDLDGGSL